MAIQSDGWKPRMNTNCANNICVYLLLRLWGRRVSPRLAAGLGETGLRGSFRRLQAYPLDGSLSAKAVTPMMGSEFWTVRISRFSRLGSSTHAQVHRLRRVRGALANSRAKWYCLPPVRTRSALESEDFGTQQLACVSTSTDAQHDVVTAVAPKLEAEVGG